MAEKTVFLIAGGDLRQIHVAKKLSEKYTVYILGFENSTENIGKAVLIKSIHDIEERVDCLILPLPVSDDNIFLNAPFSENRIPLSILNRKMQNRGIILGGKVSDTAKKLLSGEKFKILDYVEREEFSVKNAETTAEAAIQIALENRNLVLHKSNILITGFGRISKALIKILKGFEANITVAARKKSDLCWAEIYGCKGIEISDIKEYISKYDVIFNTVPSLIIDKSILEKIKENAYIIDLASKPGGVDFAFASKKKINVNHALSLPGKYFPATAGETIAETAVNIINERRFLYE